MTAVSEREVGAVGPETLDEAFSLARRLGHVLVASADAEGQPHIAAGELEEGGDGMVGVSAWFCATTLANIQVNPRLTLLLWDASAEVGLQLVGAVQSVREAGVLDGMTAEEERGEALPEVRWRLLVRLERVLRFTLAPHTDAEMGAD